MAEENFQPTNLLIGLLLLPTRVVMTTVSLVEGVCNLLTKVDLMHYTMIKGSAFRRDENDRSMLCHLRHNVSSVVLDCNSCSIESLTISL